MSRPKKPIRQKRTVRKQTRWTPQEWSLLEFKAAAENISPSDFIRRQTVGSEPESVKASPYRAAVIAFQAGLGKIRSNVDQIERALTDGGGQRPPDELFSDARLGLENLSEVLINHLASGHPGSPPFYASVARGRNEMDKLGTHVNQIARTLNEQRAKGVVAHVPAADVTGVLYGIQSLSTYYIGALGNGHSG